MDRLLDVLKKVRSRYPAFSKKLGEAEALARWDLAVGPAISKHSKAIRVQDSVLWVEVDHPIWKSELHHRKAQILEILNRPSEAEAEEVAQQARDAARQAAEKKMKPSAPPKRALPMPRKSSIPPKPVSKIIIQDILFLDKKYGEQR